MALQRASLPGLPREVFAASPERTLALVRAAWPGAVGPELARRTEVVTLERGTLRVRVPDAGWRKVLHRMQRDILSRLEAVAGRLAPRRLGFVEGGLAAPGLEPEGGPTAVGRDSPPRDRAPQIATPVLVEAARAIADADLRGRFLEVAARYLARRGAPD